MAAFFLARVRHLPERAFFMQQAALLGARGEPAVKLKILVFDPDLGLRELLKVYLAGKGHEVFAFSDATVCPLYRDLQDENCRCPLEKPCADAMLVDIHTPHINAIDLLELQRHRGCKALDENKAVMSASITKALETAVTAFGCHHIRKPFHLGDINSWIDGCKARLAARRQLSS